MDDHESIELCIDMNEAPGAKALAEAENPALSQMSDEHRRELTRYLQARLKHGDEMRTDRLARYGRIDRAISTWQKLNKDDSQRERVEDNTGRQFAIPMNIPILAAHLDDMTSYFSEALAPISRPFSTSKGTEGSKQLCDTLNRDAIARDYYGEVVLAMRSLLKYNIGGIVVDWHEGGVPDSISLTGISESGNSWRALDLYNTMWDPTIQNPRDVCTRAEWAATVRLTNRVEMARRSLLGEWVGLDSRLSKPRGMGDWDKRLAESSDGTLSECWLWRNSTTAVPTRTGEDSRTHSTDSQTPMTELEWESIGLGLENLPGTAERPFELTTMFCWIVPQRFGLLGDSMTTQLSNLGKDPEVFLELWRFELIDASVVVSARPEVPREEFLNTNSALIPMYLCFLTRDQLAEAQRSSMELLRGFQRFTSSMFSIYTEGLRASVWGVRGYDPTLFDVSALEQGQVAGWLPSKVPGRDVRAGLVRLDSGAGVESAITAVSNAMGLKDQLFPNQALPSQIAGMERAVQSQVSSVVHGAQRPMRMMLRLIDSALMLPTRIAAVRNLRRYAPNGIPEITDEEIADVVGSGIESIEAERIVEVFWRLMTAIIQNEEAMRTFNVPAMMAYIGRLMNLSVDMASFVRQQPTQPAPEGAVGTPPGAQQPQPPQA